MVAFVVLGFLLLIMVAFIIGMVIFLAGVISLIIYIAVKRKKKKRIRPIIALPIVAVVIGLVLSSPVLVVSGSNLNSYLKNQAELRDTGVFVEMEKRDSTSLVFEGKTYIQLGPHLDDVGEYALYRAREWIHHGNAVANIVFTEEKEEETVPSDFMNQLVATLMDFYVYETKPVCRLYRPDGLENNNILYSDVKYLWCAEDYLSEAISYYNDSDNYDYYLMPESPSDMEKVRIKIDPSEVNNIVNSYASLKKDPKGLLEIKQEDANIFRLCTVSKDDVVMKFVPVGDMIIIYNDTIYFRDRAQKGVFYCYPTGIKLSKIIS